jgi:hypothetical protein
MREYFKPNNYWGHDLRHWLRGIKNFFRWVKWSWQRAFRGWADCDVWSVDSYLSEIIPPMIERLNRITHGYPADLEGGEKKWGEILTKIQQGFEASRRIRNLDNWEKDTPWSDEDVKSFKQADDKDFERMNEGLELFKEHFFSLWD